MAANPLALIAEITRSALHCVYCSNPLELTSRKEELATGDWLRVFGEAAALGVLHLHLAGGEPLARTDLAEMIAGARQSRLYTNLITSGIGLSRERLADWQTPATFVDGGPPGLVNPRFDNPQCIADICPVQHNQGS